MNNFMSDRYIRLDFINVGKYLRSHRNLLSNTLNIPPTVHGSHLRNASTNFHLSTIKWHWSQRQLSKLQFNVSNSPTADFTIKRDFSNWNHINPNSIPLSIQFTIICKIYFDHFYNTLIRTYYSTCKRFDVTKGKL